MDSNLRSTRHGLHFQALRLVKGKGFPDDDVKHLRSASLHWLRHTSATADAKVRDHIEDL
ncbi:hypothetical protein PSYTB_14415 [Pseudomonas amygdali pv. tabaci str. ATCC 11528]|nr:hypothetical protein PSYTB_14415 [Pseudomonas amygdali pv. tabaci str. ATCC 11528]